MNFPEVFETGGSTQIKPVKKGVFIYFTYIFFNNLTVTTDIILCEKCVHKSFRDAQERAKIMYIYRKNDASIPLVYNSVHIFYLWFYTFNIVSDILKLSFWRVFHFFSIECSLNYANWRHCERLNPGDFLFLKSLMVPPSIAGYNR